MLAKTEALDRALDFIYVKFPTCSGDMAKYFAFEGVIAFMRDTRIFRDSVEITPQTNVFEYPIEEKPCRPIFHIEEVYLERNGTWVNIQNYGGRADIKIDHIAKVIRIPSSIMNEKRIKLRYSYLLSRDGCAIPDVILNQWLHAIMSYVEMELHLVKESGHYSPDASRRAELKYMGAVEEAIELQNVDTTGSVRIDTPFLRR